MPGSIQSIERAAAVLRLLAAPPGRLTLAQVVSSLQLAKGTAHGILRTLVEVGFVEQDSATGQYLIADGLRVLGAPSVDPNEIRARSMNWADPLAARTGQAVQVGVLVTEPEVEVVLVHHVFRPDGTEQELATGARLPTHASALGKVLLAYSPAVTSVPLGTFTRRTITDPRQLAEHVRGVRQAGYAVEVDEFVPGRAAVAAPIAINGGTVIAAVAVVGDRDDLCDVAGRPRRPILSRVLDCARHISGELAATRAEVGQGRGGARR